MLFRWLIFSHSAFPKSKYKIKVLQYDAKTAYAMQIQFYTRYKNKITSIL